MSKIPLELKLKNPLYILRIKHNGISKLQLSKEIQINRATLSKIENGETAQVHPSTISAITSYFNISYNSFLNDYELWLSQISIFYNDNKQL